MKISNKILSSLALAAVMGWASVAHADMQTFDPLPDPNCGLTQANNCVQFGDFSVYSLALLNYQVTGTTGFNPGDPYYVQSAPGELLNDGYIVYGTGTNNNKVVTNGAGTLIDDAQQQPNGSGESTFVVGAASETAPTFTGDINTTWTGTLSAIRTELAAGSSPDGQFVIYFNLNETGTDGLDGIDLLSWFHVQLIDAQGILPTLNYYLTGGAGTTAPVITDITDPNWVYVHGTICVSPTYGFLGFGPCDSTQNALGGINLNQNLGANQAAFAIFNQGLSDLVLNSDYDIISGNWQFAKINNGYEQQFSALSPTGNFVPEPGSLLLLGMGLASLGLVRSKKKRGVV